MCSRRRRTIGADFTWTQRERVTIAYGRDEVTNFGSLLALGARERLSHSVTGAERAIETQAQVEAERADRVRQAQEREHGRGQDHGISYGR